MSSNFKPTMRTLVLLYPGCIEFEIMLVAEILNPKFPVEVATPTGATHKGSNGMQIIATNAYESVDPNAYKAILVPGGDPGSVIGNESLSKILKTAYSNGAILGAICAGPVILEQAGLLKGHRIAHGYKGPQLNYLNTNGFFRDTQLTEEPMLSDRNIVTARPDSFIDFAIEIARLCAVVTDNKVSSLRQYYRGTALRGILGLVTWLVKTYLRILSILYLIGGILHVLDLLDLRLKFSEMPVIWKIWIIYLANFDLAASVGLWRRRRWGEVLFLIIALSQIIAYLGYSSYFHNQWPLLIFHGFTLLVYAIFTKMNSTSKQRDIQQYKLFLKHCQCENIMVCANNGPNLKRSNGWWNGKQDLSAEIHVYRSEPSKSGFVGTQSTDLEISDFISNAEDIQLEIAILLHEFGHWKSQHPHRAVADSVAYNEELQAYNEGESLAKSIFGGDWNTSVFLEQKAKGLASYQNT